MGNQHFLADADLKAFSLGKSEIGKHSVAQHNLMNRGFRKLGIGCQDFSSKDLEIQDRRISKVEDIFS